MKKLTAICLSLILVLASTVLCFGDGLYEIDAQSGQIVGAKYGSDEEPVDYVRLTTSCAYSKTKEMYEFTGLGTAGVSFSCSVCNGMYTTDAVILQSDPTTQLRVFLNGEQLEYEGEGEFDAVGTYIVRDRDNSLVLSFTILDYTTNAVSAYDVAPFFFVDSVYHDGVLVEAPGNRIDMTEDGEYRISYYCYDTEVNYVLDVIIDHTAPELEITGLDQNNIAHNAVVLSDRESGSAMVILKDGDEIPLAQTLTASGEYEIRYSDEAGNTSTYYFTIRPYLDANAWTFVFIVALLLIGVGAFMIYTRTHMRVR
ncbi:MAG: hypothetical protein MJ194_06640 [Clostridia bacterium]|nr:hypothetical protein [Clostridia bacterium]